MTSPHPLKQFVHQRNNLVLFRLRGWGLSPENKNFSRREGGGGGGEGEWLSHINNGGLYLCNTRSNAQKGSTRKWSFLTKIFVPLARISSGFDQILFFPHTAVGQGGGQFEIFLTLGPPPPPIRKMDRPPASHRIRLIWIYRQKLYILFIRVTTLG